MSEELQNPPVVDFDLILQPISGENPSGEDVKYSGIYDQIREARRADDEMDQGDWKTDTKVANYRLVIDLAVPSLSTTSKDLQIAVWLSEALARTHGLAGIRDGLKILAQMQDSFWDTLYPEMEDGDQEGRANALAWADKELAESAQFVALTGGSSYNYRDWMTSQTLIIPDNIDSMGLTEGEEIKNRVAKAEADGKVTYERWQRDVGQTRRAFIENVNLLMEECWTAFNDLNRTIDEKFDRNQAPSLTEFKKGFENIHLQVKRILELKRAEEPDPVELSESEGDTDAGEGGTSAGGKRSGAVQSRADALSRLGEIAAFFQATEPHSPVSYLVQRAVKWGNMPLDSWLQEVIKDESVLFNVRETLGVTGQQGDNY